MSQPAPNGAVQPQPSPFSPVVSRVVLQNGMPAVMCEVYTITGKTVLFMPPEGAVQFGQDLLTNGRGAASGLVLPPGVNIPPPHTENGHNG